MQPITAKWIYRIKKGPSGTPDKLKARIEARGFQQKDGIDYIEIFAPVVRWSTIRIIFSLAAKYNWTLHHMDVITAFLNVSLDDNVIMEVPEGFPGASDPSKVCRN